MLPTVWRQLTTLGTNCSALSALHTMLRHAVHRALYGAHSTIVCLTSTAGRAGSVTVARACRGVSRREEDGTRHSI